MEQSAPAAKYVNGCQSHISMSMELPPPKKNPMVVSSFQVKAQKSCEGGFGLQILYLLMYHFSKQIKPNCSHIICTEISFSSKGGISCSLLSFSITRMSNWKKRTQQKGFINLKVFLI